MTDLPRTKEPAEPGAATLGAEGSLVVLIVNYGLVDRIDSLLGSGALRGHRVLVVDNASEPERVRAVVSAHGGEALLLHRNYGFGGAVNRGVVHAGPPPGAWLLLNPDVRLDASTVSSLHRELVERRLTGVTPLLLDNGGSVQVGTAGGPLTLRGFAAYFLGLSHLLPRSRGVFFTRRQLLRGLEPSWACMACLMLDGDAFTRFGPIPEEELVYGEDLAWGWRASRGGGRFAVVPDVRVVHEQGAAGASRRWAPAVSRLAMREQGRVRGGLAVVIMWLGLLLRRMAGRRFW